MKAYELSTLSLCTYCPRLCRHACPYALGESNETFIPTHKVGFVQLWQESSIPLSNEIATTFFACSDCGACTEFCKHGATPSEILYQARTDAIQQNFYPPFYEELLEKCKAQGHLAGEASPQREKLLYNPKAPIQLLAGEWMGWKPEEIQLFVKALSHLSQKEVSVLPHSVSSCLASYELANKSVLEKQFSELKKHVSSSQQLIVADPLCEKQLKEVLPKQGLTLSLPVLSLLEIFQETELAHASEWFLGEPVAFFHDPSYYARFGGDFELPRRLLHQMGFQTIEFSRNKRQAWASGADGIHRHTFATGARRNASYFLREVYAYGKRNEVSFPQVVTIGESSRSLFSESEPALTFLDLNSLVAKAYLANHTF